MPISFNSIPRGWKVPLVYVEVDPSQAGTPTSNKIAMKDAAKNVPTQKVEGSANLRIDLNGFPANTRTGFATSGDLFNNADVTTNRGFTAPNASETE